MKILALEFSSSQRSVAALRTEANRPHSVSEVVEAGSGSTRALTLVDEALREAKLEREEIEYLAVGLGPGSYTGIRAAIAFAQGWQLARPIKLIGVSSTHALAAQAKVESLFGTVGVVIDAQQGELYFAPYKISEKAWKEIAPLKIVPLAEVKLQRENGVTLIGPEVTRWIAEGIKFFPRAATLAELTATRSDQVANENLAPIYLRETRFLKAPKPGILP